MPLLNRFRRRTVGAAGQQYGGMPKMNTARPQLPGTPGVNTTPGINPGTNPYPTMPVKQDNELGSTGMGMPPHPIDPSMNGLDSPMEQQRKLLMGMA